VIVAKISELIETLEKYKQDHGNIDLFFGGMDEYGYWDSVDGFKIVDIEDKYLYDESSKVVETTNVKCLMGIKLNVSQISKIIQQSTKNSLTIRLLFGMKLI
jgi:hypothetical protein